MARIECGCLAVAALMLGSPALAGEADVLQASARAEGGGRFSFEVTVQHADTGWEHYADAWEVLTEAGEILGRRVLYHPHVDEQPFTRSLSGVVIPAGVHKVVIRARDKVHGHGGRSVVVELPAESQGSD